MKKLLMLVGALFMTTVMHAQYFCSTPNAELHYVNYDEAGQSVSNATAYVQNVDKSADRTFTDYLFKNVTTKANNNTSYSLTRWTYQNGKSVCAEDLMYGLYIADDSDPAQYNEATRMKMLDRHKFKGDNSFFLKDDAKAGEEMPDRFYQIAENMIKKEVYITGATYMGEEQVSTTAGRFNCIKISYLQRSKIVLKNTTVRVNEWYAKGIGLVKREVFDMKGRIDSKTLLVKVVK